jgi:hypothetical protein
VCDLDGRDRGHRLFGHVADGTVAHPATHLNRVQSDMRHIHIAFGFGDVLDLGETRFKI